MLLPVLALIGATGLDVRLEEARGLDDVAQATLTEQVRARAALRGATGTLLLRALAIPGTIRVTLSRADASPRVVAHADLVGAIEQWTIAIDGALDALGMKAAPIEPTPPLELTPPLDPPVTAPPPVAPSPPTPIVAPRPPAPERGLPVLGLTLLGSGVVVGAAGVVFGVLNASARSDGNPLPAGPERDAFDDRAVVTGVTANVLLGVAALALVTGAVVMLAD